MIIKKTSPFTGIQHTMDLDVTFEQMDCFYKGELLIQDIFPDLSAGEREFILTGITDEEWEAHMKED